MRVLPVALALSAALHGGAIAWVHTHPKQDSEPPPPVTLAPVEIVPAAAAPEPEPMVVALLPDHSVVGTGRTASSERHTRAPAKLSHGAAARQETAPAPGAIEPPPVADPGTTRHSLMTMRKPTPKLDTAPPSDFMARFLANSRPLAPKDIAGEQLADELRGAEANLKNPRWIANASPDQVAAEREKLVGKRYEMKSRELQPDGTGTKAEHQTFTVRVAADGTARIEDKANLQRKGLGGTFDVTDAMMRRQGIDPYASYKLKVLDETRDERVAIGQRYRTQQLARSRQLVQAHLTRLWATTTDLAARKQALFELWDDCAETGSAELVVAGRAAREHVVGFIRSKLPAGSAHAFTADELARLNRQRRSRIEFAPY